MHQDRDEPVRNYGARLRGQAGVCKFLVNCTNCDANVNCRRNSEDVVTRNIIDNEVQLKIFQCEQLLCPTRWLCGLQAIMVVLDSYNLVLSTLTELEKDPSETGHSPLLGDSNQDMTLEQVLKFVEAKEAGKRSASRLLHTQSVDATHSTYRKEHSEALKQRHEQSDATRRHQYNQADATCMYCDKKGYGKRAPPKVRSKECSAYNHKCKTYMPIPPPL